jgi:hypothetical protein
MTDVLTATDYEVPSPGQHRVRIEEVSKRDGKFGPYYRLGTKVVDGPYEDLWVSFVASAKMSPAAKLRIAIEDILGRKLKKGEQFSPDSLKGMEAIAEVSNKPENERTFANIDQFVTLPENNGLRVAQEEASKAKDSADAAGDEDEDYEDIPF